MVAAMVAFANERGRFDRTGGDGENRRGVFVLSLFLCGRLLVLVAQLLQ